MQTELTLTSPTQQPTPRKRGNGTANRLSDSDRPAHDWYRFVLSYPPHLVRDYLTRFGLGPGSLVLDPFCGTGTTLVECKKLGIPSVGIEANPMAQFTSSVKVDWRCDPDGLVHHARRIADVALRRLARKGLRETAPLCLEPRDRYGLKDLDAERRVLLAAGSISPVPLHRTLVLLDAMAEQTCADFDRHERLAPAKALVTRISNVQFGPEVGVGPQKSDVPAVTEWLSVVRAMSDDLRLLRSRADTEATVILADARSAVRSLPSASIDAVISSPPYPNEKDYTRTTRLESVLLGFVRSKRDLQALKRSLLCSNTRGVYKDDDDHVWVDDDPKIQRIADEIEARRVAMGKTSGFERLYAPVTKLYFGGMARRLAELRPALKNEARLAYVVGDQGSYLRVMIRTGELLASLATSLGFEVLSTDLFRTRLATATREQLREEVLVLRWPGYSGVRARACARSNRNARERARSGRRAARLSVAAGRS